MRKVTVYRMRERYAQTVLTFRITYVLHYSILLHTHSTCKATNVKNVIWHRISSVNRPKKSAMDYLFIKIIYLFLIFEVLVNQLTGKYCIKFGTQQIMIWNFAEYPVGLTQSSSKCYEYSFYLLKLACTNFLLLNNSVAFLNMPIFYGEIFFSPSP